MTVPHPDGSTFELKSAQWPLVSLLLKSTDWAQLRLDLQRRFGDNPGFFDHDPVLIDLSMLTDDQLPVAPEALLAVLAQYRLCPVAIRGGGPGQADLTRQAGLVQADDAALDSPALSSSQPEPAVVSATAPVQPALVLDRPLRSGQQVYARGRDLVVLAMVNPGAEVIADGHIHVYAPLRGKAIAGARGNTDARIFTSSLEAELLSIAGVYRTSDTPLPANVQARPAQVRLRTDADGQRLLIEPLS
jgi:septum site-determining protein MinC